MLGCFDHRNTFAYRQARYFGGSFGAFAYGGYGYNPYVNPYDFGSIMDPAEGDSAYDGAWASPYDDASFYSGSSEFTGDSGGACDDSGPAGRSALGERCVDLSHRPDSLSRFAAAHAWCCLPVPGAGTLEQRW